MSTKLALQSAGPIVASEAGLHALERLHGVTCARFAISLPLEIGRLGNLVVEVFDVGLGQRDERGPAAEVREFRSILREVQKLWDWMVERAGFELAGDFLSRQ